jgi:ATP-binding cassette subfamily B multidrug efflux pump
MFAQDDRELEGAREAMTRTRDTFQREMRLFTVMDICLTLLNGL